MLKIEPVRVRHAAIVGAGIGGLSCARALVRAGWRVTMFDKSRGVGGRCTTRRVEGEAGPLSFDHGAQYFTVRDPSFAEDVARWREAGQVQVWRPRLWALDGAGGPRASAGQALEDQTERLVAVPGMSALGKLLLADIEAAAEPGQFELHRRARVLQVHREKFDWLLEIEGGGVHEGFSKVVLNTPSGQAAPLFGVTNPKLRARAEACEMEACWALMIEPLAPLELEFDAAFVNNSPLAWIADNSTKPGRPPTPCWVLQASGAWSWEHFERDREFVARELMAVFEALVGRSVPHRVASTQRWRYAKPEPLPEPYLYSSLGIGACGDWCGGPRVEGAYLSGLVLAQSLIEADLSKE